MEKSAKHKRFFCFGLLILFVPFLCTAFSEPVLESPKTTCYESDVLTFIILIKDCQPKSVSFSVPKPEGNVTRLSLNKIQTYEHGSINTKIEVVYSFKKAGTFNLPDVQISINNNSYNVKFPQILVYFNPALHKPEVKWELQTSEVVAGKPCSLVLTAKYVTSINSIEISQPEDALFKQTSKPTRDFEYKPSVTEPSKTVIAQYDWTPLQSGTLVLPSVNMEITGTNGTTQTIVVPEQTVKVKKPADGQLKKEDFATLSLENAFQEEEQTQESLEQKKTIIDKNLADQIAALRKAEKYNLNFWESQKLRQELEKANSINAPDELPILFVLIPAALFLICLFIFVFVKKAGKNAFANILLILTIIFFAASSYCSFIILTPKAVFAGGQIFAIPDENGSILEESNCGTLFIVKKQTNDWVMVKYGDNRYGWVKNNTLGFIEEAD